MRLATGIGIALVVLGSGLGVAPAQAGGWWGFPYAYSLYDLDYIPYFAKHPPVYYSYPVARTYGYSPYAYPPTVMTPELPRHPKVVLNPYVSQPASRVQETTPRTVEAAAPQPKLVSNPYVVAALPGGR